MNPIIRAFLRDRYEPEKDRHLAVADRLRAALSRALKSEGVRHIATSRVKSRKSLRDKLMKSASAAVRSGDDVLRLVKDFAGIRVTLYFPSERLLVERLVYEMFTVDEYTSHPEEVPVSKLGRRFEGYTADHYLLRESPVDAPRVELQVASLMMHAWSEVEHDLLYKPQRPQLAQDELALLDTTNGIAIAAEVALDSLYRRRRQRAWKGKRRRLEIGTPFLERWLRDGTEELLCYGTNLHSLTVGHPSRRKGLFGEDFKRSVFATLARKRSFRVRFVVADPSDGRSTKLLGYGDPDGYRKDLSASLGVLRRWRDEALTNGLGKRFQVGLSRQLQRETALFLDPSARAAERWAFLRRTPPAVPLRERIPIIIEECRHPLRFAEFWQGYRRINWRPLSYYGEQ